MLGGAALAGAIAPIAEPLRWVAAAVLLLLAAHTARTALTARTAQVTDNGPSAPAPDTGPPTPEDRAGRSGLDGLSATRETNRTTPASAFLGILGLTLLNPATVVYFAALVLGRGDTGGGAWFVLGAFLASASWQLLIAASGSLAGRFLTSPRARLITALVSSAVIAVLAVGLVW